MCSCELLVLIVFNAIVLLVYDFVGRDTKNKELRKLDSVIATFKKSDCESLIEKKKRLEQEKSNYSKISSKGAYKIKFFGIIASLIINTFYAWGSIGLEGKNTESKIFFSIAPIFLIAIIEMINMIYEKNKEEIEEKIQSEIDNAEYQLYQYFDHKQQNLTIKLSDGDSLSKNEKAVTYE